MFEAWLLPILTIGMTDFGPLTLSLMLVLLFLSVLFTGTYLFAFQAEDASGMVSPNKPVGSAWSSGVSLAGRSG
ncbi:MAG: hypothetical protein IPG80_03530 [Anaerolineales bacterium]|uniref:hypothetical protein n=1 Tax=Candidatus Villigracilis vicinus TaxID=3140679 RepID=UPI0031355973|nr:hypothetical protein [Anaerolineales bacterium]